MSEFTVVFNTNGEYGGTYTVTESSDFIMGFMVSVLAAGWTVESVEFA